MATATKKSLPRCYEETKPSFIQQHAHKKILQIGDSILDELNERYRQRFRYFLTRAEDRVHQDEEIVREKAVQVAIETVKKEQEEKENQEKEELEKVHQRVNLADLAKHAKAEGNDVTLTDRRESEDVALIEVALDREKTKWSGIVDQMVHETEQKWWRILLDSVSIARQQERDVMQKTIDDMERDFKLELEKAEFQGDEIRFTEKKQLIRDFNKALINEVAEAHVKEKKIASDNIESLKSRFTTRLEAKTVEESDLQETISKLRKELRSSEQHVSRLKSELETMSKEFQRYVEESEMFRGETADYLFPQMDEYSIIDKEVEEDKPTCNPATPLSQLGSALWMYQ